MKRNENDMRGPGLWFKAAAALLCVAAIAFFWYLVQPRPTPGDILESYVGALSRGRCAKAWRLVSWQAKHSTPRYAAYDDFKQSVCDDISGKYTSFRVYWIDDISIDKDVATVNYRFRYRTSFMPEYQNRPSQMLLRRESHRWKIDGPTLEL